MPLLRTALQALDASHCIVRLGPGDPLLPSEKKQGFSADPFYKMRFVGLCWVHHGLKGSRGEQSSKEEGVASDKAALENE